MAIDSDVQTFGDPIDTRYQFLRYEFPGLFASAADIQPLRASRSILIRYGRGQKKQDSFARFGEMGEFAQSLDPGPGEAWPAGMPALNS